MSDNPFPVPSDPNLPDASGLGTNDPHIDVPPTPDVNPPAPIPDAQPAAPFWTPESSTNQPYTPPPAVAEAAANWQAQPNPEPGGAFIPTQPPVAPAKKSKLPLIIGGGVVGLLLLGGAVVALGGGDDGLDAAKALEGLEVIIDDTDFEEGFAELSSCPLGTRSGLGDAIDEFSKLDGSVEAVGVTYSDPDETQALQCARTEDGFAGFIASSTPEDEDYIEWVESTLVDIDTVDDEKPVAFKGGEIYRYCVEFESEEAGAPFCSVDWVSKGFTIGDFAEGDDPDALDDLEKTLKAQLPGMLDKLAEKADE